MAKKSWHQNAKRAPKEARTSVEGIIFDSKTELERWEYLKLLIRAKEIFNLEYQKSYELKIPVICAREFITVKAGPYGSKRIAKYTPDFEYQDKSGNIIIEDIKGYSDDTSKLRIRVFEAFFQQKVTIVKKIRGKWVSS